MTDRYVYMTAADLAELQGAQEAKIVLFLTVSEAAGLRIPVS